jgi:hypothetical protein
MGKLKTLMLIIDERDRRYQQRFEQQNASLAIAMSAAEKATAKAEAAIERRLEGQNEFRAQLSDQTHTFITKREVYLAFGLIITVVVAAQSVIANLTGP